ncbi:polycystin-1-like protein 1 [Mantella aurantiaca]
MKVAIRYSVLNISVAVYESTLQHLTKFEVNLQATKHYIEDLDFTDVKLIQIHIQEIAKGCLYNQISFPSASKFSCSWTIHTPLSNYSLPGSSLNVTTEAPGIYLLDVYLISPLHNSSLILSIHKQVKVVGRIDNVTAFFTSGTNYATLSMNANGSYSTQTLQFRVFTIVEANFVVDFGDGTTNILLLGSLQPNGVRANAHNPFELGNRKTCIRKASYLEGVRYNVVVKASNKVRTFTSDVHTIFVQTKVFPYRIIASSSVLINSNVSFDCRINDGTNVSYFWNFGDGIKRPGQSNDIHVYRREGEYTVNVSMFNNVSSAFLTFNIFVVKEPCQPPPVKNMGPTKLQIRRYEELYLGVTFEATVKCHIPKGLKYHWSFMKPDGTSIFLPAHVENSKQTITLPAFSLDYGNYTALARVQIIGTVVYSNYTVAFEIQPTAPVSVIENGHHLFIDKNTVKYFILNGTASFDPDKPGSSLRFFWKCSPLTKQHHSCFNSGVLNPLQRNDAVITFPTTLLNDKFDQFQFSLSVSSGDRKSSSSDMFLSIRPGTNYRFVSDV